MFVKVFWSDSHSGPNSDQCAQKWQNLAELDTFLQSDNAPDQSMALSDLDGFLTGVVCSPVSIVPSEWLPVALETEITEIQSKIIALIMERYNDISVALNRSSPSIEPVFWQVFEGHVIAMD